MKLRMEIHFVFNPPPHSAQDGHRKLEDKQSNKRAQLAKQNPALIKKSHVIIIKLYSVPSRLNISQFRK